MANGLGGFSSRGGSDWSFSAPRFSGVSKGGGLTELQLLRLLHARENKPKRSFISTLKHIGDEAILDPALWTFDKLLRPNYAIVAALKEGGGGDKDLTFGDFVDADFWKAAGRGLRGKEKNTFSHLLKEEGLLKGHGRLRGTTGFLMDVALDPTTYLSLGAGAVAKGSAKAGVSATKSVLRDSVEGMTQRQASEALQSLKPQLKTLEDLGEPFVPQAQLGRIKQGLLRKQAFGAPVTPAERVQLNVARRVAQDALDQLPRQIEVGVRLPFVGKPLRAPTHIPAPRVQALSRIPLVGKGASTVGKAIVPGFEDPALHGAAMVRKHSAEELASTHLEVMRQQFRGLEHLSESEQRRALHFFEKKGGVVKDPDSGEFVLNPARVEEALQAGLREEHVRFAEAMHSVGSYLAKQHDEFGVEFAHLGNKGQLYVPHIMRKTGSPLQNKHRSILSERGFQKGRKGEFTVAQLHAMKRAGNLPKDVETNPMMLLAMHLRAVSNKQADAALSKYLVDTHGVAGRVVDSGSVRELEKQLGEVGAKIASHPAQGLDEASEITKIIKEHSDVAKQALRDEKATRTQTIKDFLENRPWDRTSMATVTRLSKQNAALGSKLRVQLARIRSLEDPKVKKAVAARKAEIAVQRKELDALTKQLDELEKGLTKARKGTKNSLVSGDMVELKGMKDEFGNAIHVPREIAEPITRMKQMIEADDETLAKFGQGYRKWLGKWKLGVTSVNPGYHTRNMLSDYWNMWLAGMSIPQMAFYGGKAARLMARAKKGDPKAVSAVTDAYHHGVLSGLYQGDVQEIAFHLQYSGSKRSMARRGRAVKLTTKAIQDMSRNRENFGRMTHYLWRRETQKMGIAEASKWVRVAHFDYEDLTPFEQKVMKSIAPFYTWTRKNVPYQVRSIFSAPGRMAAFPKAASALEGDSGEGQIVPDYMQKGMYIRLPNGKYVAPMIGVTDLAKINPANWQDTISSLVNPMFKVPAEVLTNRSMMTDRPIFDPEGHPRNPVNDRLADVLSLLPGSNVGQTKRGGNVGAGMDPRWSYVFSQLPLTNTLVNRTGKIRDAQYGPGAKSLAYLTGFNASELDQEQQRLISLLEEESSFKGFLKGLRDEGLIPPAGTRRKSANQKLIEDILFKTLEGR